MHEFITCSSMTFSAVKCFKHSKIETGVIKSETLPGAQCHVALHLLHNIHNAQVNSIQYTVPC